MNRLDRCRRPWFAIWMTLLLWSAGPCLPAMAEQRPPSPEEQRILVQARKLLDADQGGQAEKLLAAHLSANPEGYHSLVAFTLGNAQARQHKHAQALANYRLAARLNPEDPAIWHNLGKVAFDTQQYVQAAEALLKAHARSLDKDPQLLFHAAYCFIANKTPEKALPLLEEICDRPAKEGTVKAEWRQALANAYIETGQPGKAVGRIRELIRGSPDNPLWWKVLADLQLRLKVYDQAAAAFQIYLELAAAAGGASFEERMTGADLYLLAGVPLKAASRYEKAAALAGRPPDYRKIAAAYTAAHRPDEAVAWLRRGLEKSQDPELWGLLGATLYNQGKYAEALEAYERKLARHPDDGQSALFLGYCALRLDRPRRAGTAFAAATRSPRHRAAAQKALAQIENLIR
jgi:tetratricopeptide (TPR) repeat protein